MELISNSSFITNLAAELIGPKPSQYSIQQLVQNANKCQNRQFKCHNMQVAYIQNQKRHTFKAYHITDKNKTMTSCIVYLHGLSSYSLQGQFLLPYLPKNFSLCVYDLRGHGKNTQGYISYGINEAKDLYFLIQKLKQQGIKQIYLWGRSMGAATILNFLKTYSNDENVMQTIKYVIVDSAYSSFQRIVLQTAQKDYGIPRILGHLLIGILFNKAKQQAKSNINFNTLDFSKLANVNCPAIFVYSEKDQIISYSNTTNIMNGYGGQKYSIKGQFLHNDLRSRKIINDIFKIICQNKQNMRNSHKNNQRKGISVILSPKNTQISTNRQNKKQRLQKKFELTYTKPSNKNPISPLTPLKQNNRLETQGISMSIKNKLEKIKLKARTEWSS